MKFSARHFTDPTSGQPLMGPVLCGATVRSIFKHAPKQTTTVEHVDCKRCLAKLTKQAAKAPCPG